MAGKLTALLDKIKGKLPASLRTRSVASARRGMTGIKIVALGSTSVLLATGLGIAAWFVAHPLNGYRPAIAGLLREQLQADELRLGELSWRFSLKKMSIGVRASELSFTRPALLHRFHSSNLEVSVHPFRAFLGKMPLSVEAFGGTLALKATGAAPPAGADVASPRDPLQDWLKRTSIAFRVRDLAVSVDPRLFSRAEREEASLYFEIKDITGAIDGVPGPFNAKLTSQLDFDWDGGASQVLGPASFEFEGGFQSVDGEPLGARIDSFRADLGKVRYVTAAGIDKRADQELSFESKVQIVFDQTYLISKIDLVKAAIRYEELPLQAEVGLDFKKQELAMTWDSGRREVKKLRFPARGFTSIPFRGYFESTGSLKLSRRGDPQLAAKVALNNFRLDLKDLIKEDHIDPASRGELLFSIVAEIGYHDRVVSSPRIEVQATAHEAQIEMQGGRYVKPRGDELAVFLKAKIADGALKVEKAAARVNNLDFESRGGIEAFNSWFHDQEGAVARADFRTNAVNLTEWSSYLPWFRKIPLQGRAEAAGTLEGPLRPGTPEWSRFSWRLDRLSLAQVRGSFEKQDVKSLGYTNENWGFVGPFAFDVLFQGRGTGPVIQKALFSALVDLNGLDVSYKDTFRKPAGQPLSIDVSAEQTQNRLSIRRGTLKLLDNSVLLSGRVMQGSKRNAIHLKLEKPLKLEEWRPYFQSLPDGFPSLGKVLFEGKLGFGVTGEYEESLDWSQFGFDGYVLLEDVALRARPFAYPVRGLTGGLWVEGSKLVYPDLRFSVDDSRFAVSGESQLLNDRGSGKDKGSKQGNLTRLFSGEAPWSVRAQIQVDRYREGILGDPLAAGAADRENMKSGPPVDLFDSLREFATSPRAAKSEVNLRLSVREAPTAKEKTRAVTSIVKWKDGRLAADPFSARLFGGRARGSFVYDAQPWYQRKDPPQISMAGRFEGIELEPLATLFIPAFEGRLAGRFDGEARLAADGFDVEALRASARGRVQGKATGFAFSPLKPVDAAIGELIKESDAADYVAGRADPAQCLSGPMTAGLDMNLVKGRLSVQRMDVVAANRTRVSALGQVEPDGKFEVKGKVLAGPSCLAPRASACLEDKVLGFELSASLAKPKLAFDTDRAGRRIASCLSVSVEKEAERAIEAESRAGSSANARERELRERILNSIRGKKSSK